MFVSVTNKYKMYLTEKVVNEEKEMTISNDIT